MEFRGDERAQSVVIGSLLIFTFLIIAFSGYQAFIVPQQNTETEFQHSQEVRNDLVELRAGISQAGSIDQPQYQTVQLGTIYSSRAIARNPPPPAGAIRTTDPYPITISNGTETITIPTRFIEYRPGYTHLDTTPTWYDASVLYLDDRDDGGGIAVIEEQTLFDDGAVHITAVQNEFRRSGTGRVTVELYPTEDVTDDEIPKGDLTVTVPTRLSNTEYWDDTDIPDDKYSVTDANGDGVHDLTLETTSSDLTVDTIGVQEAPEDATQNDAAQVGGTADTSGESEAPQFVGGSTPSEESTALEFEVENRADEDITITDFSISIGSSKVSNINRDAASSPNTNAEVRIGTGYATRDPPENQNFKVDGTTYSMNPTAGQGQKATISSGERISINMGEFDDGNVQLTYTSTENQANSDMVATLSLEDGTTVEYHFDITNYNT